MSARRLKVLSHHQAQQGNRLELLEDEDFVGDGPDVDCERNQ